ncbi:MAG TPA: tetratricopeptide repeat protein [Bryobacteraceae bacterium]|nr:tetratricopeptide repeat protein [Bryobacteraceae bacterium]
MAALAAKQAYSRREVCRWLEITERQIRSWEAQKLIPALETFSLADVGALRTLAELRKAKVSAAALRKAIAALRERWGGAGNPLSEVKLYSDGRKISVQFAGTKMEPVSGQLLFDFDAAEIGKLRSFPRTAQGSPETSKIQKKHEAEAWFEKGLLLEKSGAAMEEILDAYRRAAQIDPASAGALVNLGTVYFNARRWREAEEYYRMALEVDNDYALAHFNLANLYDERNQRDRALVHYLAALKAHPNYADAHYNLALLFQASGQTLKAVRHWKMYLKLDPASEWAIIARRELDKLRESTIVRGARRD